MFAAIIRYFSYLYHGLLAVFLFAASSIAVGAHQSLRLDMLPWTGSTLTYVVHFGSLVGLLTVILAVFRKLPALFFLWSLAVAVLMIEGYIFSGYGFEPGEFWTAMPLMAGSPIAIAGAWLGMRPAKR